MQTWISTILISIAIATLYGAVPSALAQKYLEYCVTCTSPDTSYRCVVEIGPDATVPAARGRLLCITKLAHSGDHESCSVGRKKQGPCPGKPKTVRVTRADGEALAPIGEAPQATPRAGQPAAAEGARLPAKPPDQREPQTVKDLAEQTLKASGKSSKQTGKAASDTATSTEKAIGNAISRTWRCVNSLFSDC
jgi:hypothetical protein